MSENHESALQCAVAILEVIPLVMGSLQCQMRRDPGNPLTVPQFRALAYLSRTKIASLSQLAEHLGLGLPAASKTVDGMVTSGTIERKIDPADRRRVLLELTSAGTQTFEATHAIAKEHLARMLDPLDVENRTRLIDSMQSLRPLFSKFLSKTCENKDLSHETK